LPDAVSLGKYYVWEGCTSALNEVLLQEGKERNGLEEGKTQEGLSHVCSAVVKRMIIMVVHVCNPSTQEAEAGGSQVQSQPGLQNEILS
jgi:hypothetical protein